MISIWTCLPSGAWSSSGSRSPEGRCPLRPTPRTRRRRPAAASRRGPSGLTPIRGKKSAGFTVGAQLGVGDGVADDLVGEELELGVCKPTLELIESVARSNPAAEVERDIELVGEVHHRDNHVLEWRGGARMLGRAAEK